MKFPTMNKRPRQAVVVPDLSGGLNLRDSVSMINDNQLTDCKNVWFKDGVLKTRPGISDMVLHRTDIAPVGEMRAHDIYLEKQVEKDGAIMSYTVTETCRLFSIFDINNKGINFYWIGETYFEVLPIIENATENYFVAQKDDVLYCYSSNGISKFDYNATELKWEKISLLDTYVPIVAIDCVVDGGNFNGVMYESYNLIGASYKLIYSTVNPNHKPVMAITDGVEEELDQLHEMTYFNVTHRDKIADFAGMTIKATHIDVYGNKHKHSMVLGIDGNGKEEKLSTDNLIMNGNINGITFFHDEEFREVAKIYKDSTYIKNNLEIEFPLILEEKEQNKVFNMTCCTWFGGDSAGINGGTRLFLGGNTEEPNLVVWSDLNNPLYFPENNYFYVGESSAPVTAFGKQSDMLVIFKKDETYFTQYNRNTNIAADDLIDQTVIDYIGSSVYFPLTLINANIGCDCPDTVQLCRNRLVWANSDGKVYTLVSNNQYSERNIFEIGEMVYRKLREDKGLKKAHSTDWNGYYLLHSGNRVYVLDYNSYGYQYVSSYSKTEDANLRIPWYYWELPEYYGASGQSVLAVVDGRLKIVNSGLYGIFVCEISEECINDNMLVSDPPTTANYRLDVFPISSYLSTKLFEFGAQGYRKNVDKVILSLGNNGGVPIKVEFITDEGSEEEYITLEGEDTKAYSPGYVKSTPLNPCIRSVERFGVKLSCDGPLAVDGITLFYRVLGGVK